MLVLVVCAITVYQVVEEEFEDAVELPIEDDGTLLLTTLSAQFPGATGLKYRLTNQHKL